MRGRPGLKVGGPSEPSVWRQRLRAISGSGRLLAPFALLFPWVAVPSPLGVSLGGFGTFAVWTTKYPNFAGINVWVVLGLLCLFVCSVVPVLLWLSERFLPRKRLLRRCLLGLLVGAWLAVVIELDLGLVVVGLSSDVEAAGGPLIRVFAVCASVQSALRVEPQTA